MSADIKGACDPSRLTRFLDNALSSSEESALARHLDRCSTCRRQLEERAASPREWECLRLSEGPSETCVTLESRFEPVRRTGFGDDEDGDVPASSLAFLGPTDDPAMLGRIGPYEVIGIVGQGGMGIVLKVLDRALNRNVAVKVLAPQLAAAGPPRRRFAREAQAAAAVVHEHVIAIHAVAEFNGFPYLVMPYVPGCSLQQRIDTSGPLSLAEILRIGMQTASGLAAAHAQGLVHRDIKPANILLENGVERVLITDFGLARAVDDATLTCSGMVTGTPQYMAPEQAQGGAIDHRADLFSLGSVLYAVCTGRPPFRAETAFAMLRRVCEDRARPIRQINPEIPLWLTGIIDRLHAKDPADRFQSAAEVAELLEKCLAHVQNPAACPLPRELAWTRCRFLSGSRRSFRFRRSLAALTLLCSIGAAAYFGSRAEPSGIAGLEPRGDVGSELHGSASTTPEGESDGDSTTGAGAQADASPHPVLKARIQRLDGRRWIKRLTIQHVRPGEPESKG